MEFGMTEEAALETHTGSSEAEDTENRPNLRNKWFKKENNEEWQNGNLFTKGCKKQKKYQDTQ